jgi:hypothetical protein
MFEENLNVSNPFWRYVRNRASTFEQFLTRCTDTHYDAAHNNRVPPGMMTPKSVVDAQLKYFSDADGRCLVTHLGCYECFEQEMQIVAQACGLPAVEIQHLNVTKKPKDYREFYTPALRDLVGERFAADIARFGYIFEQPTPLRRP